MTVTEAARELGVTPRRVRALIDAGKLKARRIGPLWWVTERDLNAVRTRINGRPKKSPSARGE